MVGSNTQHKELVVPNTDFYHLPTERFFEFYSCVVHSIAYGSLCRREFSDSCGESAQLSSSQYDYLGVV